LPTYFQQPGVEFEMNAFKINIIGLSHSQHQFEYHIGEDFFRHYGDRTVSEGELDVVVTLDKRETMIETRFEIKGTVKLICDRSLDPFQYPLKINKHVIFKFGDKDEELSDEIIMIHRDSDSIELGQYIFEFITLAVPMKKLHPRYEGELDLDDESEGKIIYTSGDDSPGDDDENIDPRWEQLKKLK
jgi:uncharacterized metal-binding protein YceD (DUF177 family)